jgi:DNA ligase-1
MPQVDLRLAFRPVMLAHPLDGGLYSAEERKAGLHETDGSADWTLERLSAKLDPADFSAEWKWDGIRVQAVSLDGERRLYTRMGEEIGASFPDAIANMTFEGVADGELLVARPGEDGPVIAPFSDLQKRLGRKSPGAKTLKDGPAHIRLYDLLHDGSEDIRPLSFAERRARLDTWFAEQPVLGGIDLSPIVPFETWEDLAAIRATSRDAGEEGLMLKRLDSPYVGGRPTGPWWKWKRDPLSVDCVVMYAQRGHGKRSSFYSDYTFGCWREGPEGTELTPVGKAYTGFTDAELVKLDKWVRDNTTKRFGPVRAVKRGLVFEISFDAVQRSTRHKSGIAMRFPRIKRIRWDKPVHEADHVSALEAMIVG